MNNELRTLPIGTVLEREGWEDRRVTQSYPGVCIAVTPSRQIWAMAYIEGAWRSHRTADGYTVKPEPVTFKAEQTGPGVWKIRGGDHYSITLLTGDEYLPDHMAPNAVVRAIAGLLNGMANEVQP